MYVYSVPWVRIPSSPPRRSKVRFASFFLYKKIIRLLSCFSFFAKRYARLNCSLVSALTTFRCRYHLFASFAEYRKICIYIVRLCKIKNSIPGWNFFGASNGSRTRDDGLGSRSFTAKLCLPNMFILTLKFVSVKSKFDLF